MRRYKIKPRPGSNYSKHASPNMISTRDKGKRVRVLFGVSNVGIDVKRLKSDEQGHDHKTSARSQIVLSETLALRLMRLLYVAAREQGWCDRFILDDLHNAVDADLLRKEDE